MHVLVIGSRGQLGSALCQLYQQQASIQLTTWARPAYDITRPEICEQVADLAPDLVINAAAWTDVDGAESNPDVVYAINTLGPLYLAQGCRRCGAALVQVSSNEVFPGTPGTFYREYDLPAPQGVYARSKLAGERAALQSGANVYIVRTAWVFGSGTNDFPSKIVAAADKYGGLNVVNDEFGNPSYAPDIAAAILQLAETEHFGTYHLVNAGRASRFEFAQAVLAACGRGDVPLTPIAHSEWQRAATPPLHAVLVNQAAAALGIEMRPWQSALQAYMADVMSSA